MEKKYITKQQVKLYMQYRQKGHLTQESCAAKAGFSPRSAHTIDNGKHHTQRPKKIRTHKTRTSPIDEVWEKELLPMLEQNPELQPKTLFIYLTRTHKDKAGNPLYSDSILRTLQRRVSRWLAMNGKSKEVIFPQDHKPGQQGLSDFTQMKHGEILINGSPFKHRLYLFRLVFSKWSYVKVIQGGESFQALVEGLQEALLQLGGSPDEHRTDSLSAAYKNLTEEAKADLTEKYEALCAHYHMEPTRNNKGISHENGSVESSHGHLKNRIRQELLLRGHNDFDSIEDYEKWVQDIVLNSNRRNSKNFKLEQQSLQPLPKHKAVDYEMRSIKISNLSMIIVKNMTYSVPSRLAGHTITLHVYQRRIEGYLGGSKVLELQRKYRCKDKLVSRYVINYKHIIHALIKKPRAFRCCKYRNEILPNDTYQQIWHYLDRTESREVAPKILLRLLKLAADYDCESVLGEHILSLIQENRPINIEIIERDFNGTNPPLPVVHCQQHELNAYDVHIPTPVNNNPLGERHYAAT